MQVGISKYQLAKFFKHLQLATFVLMAEQEAALAQTLLFLENRTDLLQGAFLYPPLELEQLLPALAVQKDYALLPLAL
jgi:hypothetical protein